MKKLLIPRSTYKTRAERNVDAALSGLPEINYEHALELMERGECFSVPEGWPRNWQWLVAMKTASEKIVEQEQQIDQAQERIRRLRIAIESFRHFLDKNELWPGLKETTVACLKGGFETFVIERKAQNGNRDSGS